MAVHDFVRSVSHQINSVPIDPLKVCDGTLVRFHATVVSTVGCGEEGGLVPQDLFEMTEFIRAFVSVGQ